MKDLEQFLRDNAPETPEEGQFLLETNARLNAVEGIKKTVDGERHRGRVALIGYRDLADPYTPLMYCDFESCVAFDDLSILTYCERNMYVKENKNNTNYHAIKLFLSNHKQNDNIQYLTHI